MKSIVRNSIILLSLVFVFISCDDNGPDTSIDSVKSLVYPPNNHSVELQPTGNDVVFEWQEVKENGIMYQVAFDLPGGDFSNPVFITNSGNNGTEPSISLSQRDLNKVARLMGLLSSETGTFKWTVFTVRGFNTMKATQENTISVKRMAGFDILPLAVYLTGAATEAGDNISNATILQRIEDGVFEVFGRFTQGQLYSFTDGNNADATKFYYDFEEGVIKEDVANVGMSVPTTGVYNIRLDFTTGAAQFREIRRIALFHNSSQVYLWLPYQGFGVWSREFTLTAGGIFNNVAVAETNSSNRPSGNPVTDNLGGDDRYKFRMVSRPYGEEGDDGDIVTEWRTFLANDNKPGGSPNPNWYFIQERTNVEQWTNNQIWKINPSAWMGLNIDVSIVLRGDGPYTHTFVVK